FLRGWKEFGKDVAPDAIQFRCGGLVLLQKDFARCFHKIIFNAKTPRGRGARSAAVSKTSRSGWQKNKVSNREANMTCEVAAADAAHTAALHVGFRVVAPLR